MIHPIRDKVAMPLKLKFVVRLGLREAGFDVGGDGSEAVKSARFYAF